MIYGHEDRTLAVVLVCSLTGVGMMVEAVAVSRCHGQRTRPEAVALVLPLLGWA